MRRPSYLPIILLSMFALSCSMESSFTDVSSGGRDFLKSEIVTSGPVPADGVSELLVVVHLKNSDSSSVADFKPDYEIVKGVGVIGSECTTSDKNGIAACILRSTVAGEKLFKVSNITQKSVEKSVWFEPPRPRLSTSGISGGASVSKPVTGHIVTSTVSFSGAQKIETPEGYKVYLFSEGGMLAQ